MAEVEAGALAPVAPVDNAPGAQPVIAPDAPVVGTGEPDKGIEPVKPKTYSEEEHRKGISERLSKERKRLERTVRAELERDFYKQQLEGATAQPKPSDQPQGKPQPKDFADAESYVEALADWKVDQKLAKQNEQRQTETQAHSQQRAVHQQLNSVHEALLGPGTEKYGQDFAESLQEIPLSGAMLAALVESDVGADVAHKLITNPAEAKRIYDLSPTRQVREIAKLEAKVAAPPAISKAPAPIVPGNPAAPSKNPYDGSSTADHVKAWMNRKNR